MYGANRRENGIGFGEVVGERYAHDIIGNFNNYCSAFIDWNLLRIKTIFKTL